MQPQFVRHAEHGFVVPAYCLALWSGPLCSPNDIDTAVQQDGGTYWPMQEYPTSGLPHGDLTAGYCEASSLQRERPLRPKFLGKFLILRHSRRGAPYILRPSAMPKTTRSASSRALPTAISRRLKHLLRLLIININDSSATFLAN